MLRVSCARPASGVRVPVRHISRATKTARLVPRDPPPHFTPDGKRIFNVFRHRWAVNKRISWAALHAKPDEAMKHFAQLKAEGLAPDLTAYTALLKSFVTAKKWAEADTTFRSIEQAGLKPNAFSYGHLLVALGAQKRTADILQTLEAIRKEGLNTNERLMNQLMISLARAGAKAELEGVWEKEVRRGGVAKPTRDSYNTYIRSLLLLGEQTKAEEALRDMGALQIKPDRFTYLAFISYFARRGEAVAMSKAQRYVDKLRQHGIAVTGPVYHHLLQGWLQLKDAAKATALMDEMRKSSVAVTPLTYHMVIQGSVKAGMLPKADVFLLEMINESHLRPLRTTLTLLADAHDGAGNAKRGKEVRHLLEVYKPQPAPGMPPPRKRRVFIPGVGYEKPPPRIVTAAPVTPQAAAQPTAKV